jgi:hypothetical protein
MPAASSTVYCTYIYVALMLHILVADISVSRNCIEINFLSLFRPVFGRPVGAPSNHYQVQPSNMYCRHSPSLNLFLRQISRSLSSSATYARPSALPLDAPTPSEESEAFVSRVAAVETFFSQPRFSGLSRPYSAAAVASKQGSLPPLPLPSTLLSDKLYAIFDRAAKEGQPVHTLGAVDPVQMTQMARWLEVVYVSGWAASSLLTTANNEVGPDLG